MEFSQQKGFLGFMKLTLALANVRVNIRRWPIQRRTTLDFGYSARNKQTYQLNKEITEKVRERGNYGQKKLSGALHRCVNYPKNEILRKPLRHLMRILVRLNFYFPNAPWL